MSWCTFGTTKIISSVVRAVKAANAVRNAAKARKWAEQEMALRTATDRGAIRGTESIIQVRKGMKLTRLGDLSHPNFPNAGRYVTDFGTSADKLYLPSSNTGTITNLVVNKPFYVIQGVVANGGGI